MIRIDQDRAMALFLAAELWWDNRPMTHAELRAILLENEQWEERSTMRRFHRPNSYGLDPFREWCRRELGETGVVVVDVDNVVRRYGRRFMLDEAGDAMLIEKKEQWPR